MNDMYTEKEIIEYYVNNESSLLSIGACMNDLLSDNNKLGQLMLAVDKNNLGYIINYLNNHNFTLNTLNTLLERACYCGNFDIIKFLMMNGSDTQVNNYYCFRIVCDHNDVEIFKYVVENSPIYYYTQCVNWCLEKACSKNQMEIFNYIINNGNYDIHYMFDSPLRFASENGNLEIVKCLVFNGANINAYQNYSIRMASINNHIHIVKYLLSQIADENIKMQMVDRLTKEHKNMIYGEKILIFYKRQKMRKDILSIRNQLIPIYYHPEMKGGYNAKRNIYDFISKITFVY